MLWKPLIYRKSEPKIENFFRGNSSIISSIKNTSKKVEKDSCNICIYYFG